MSEFTDAFMQSYNTFFQQLAAFLPNLIGALVILVIGWIIAKIFRSLSIKFFKPAHKKHLKTNWVLKTLATCAGYR